MCFSCMYYYMTEPLGKTCDLPVIVTNKNIYVLSVPSLKKHCDTSAFCMFVSGLFVSCGPPSTVQLKY